jgi:YVTN family beta-propeller protein
MGSQPIVGRCFGFGVAAVLALGGIARGDGAILHKSGPIHATADGAFVWFVNPDHNSISRLATADNSILEFALPATGGPHNPRALAIRPGGSEIWVAAQDSDRVFVIDAATGMETATISLPYGSGPVAIAFPPSGDSALIAMYRSDTVSIVDATTRTVLKSFENMAAKPLSITFTGATTASVAHQFNDGDHGYVSVIDTDTLTLGTVHRIRSIDPKFGFQIPSEDPRVPEGGWIFPTSQIAVRPTTSELWIPMQLHNFRANPFSSDTVIQAAVLKHDLASLEFDLNNRVVFSAVIAHSQTSQLLGDGWNAGVAGPSDIAFNSDGSVALISMAHSNDVLVVPSSTGIAKPFNAPPLQELPVGDNPIGLAWSPVADRVYVLNYLSRDVSILDAQTWTEIARVAAVASQEPLDADILLGAKIFNSSNDFRISSNQKVSCASCHPGGETDGFVWDFSTLNAGRRKTLTMRGQSISMAPQANGRGQLHRSGDRDEVQDFEFTFSGNFMLGSGFLGLPNDPLGAPNAGLSPELDAMAAFVLSLPPLMRSPHRNTDGTLTEAAIRGAMLYQLTEGPLATGCITCHPAPAYTDFAFHNVGGFRPLPDFEGPAFNTPSLVSSWDSGGFRQVVPISGAAITRQVGLKMWDVLRSTDTGGLQPDLHGNVSQLSHALMRDLEAFLNELDGNLAAVDITTLTDSTPPRVVAMLPVSMTSVEVVFSEAVDPVTASDPGNYTLTDGTSAFEPTAATVNEALGNRVRLTVPLVYSGCTSTYTLIPGPIADLAQALGAPQANVLDVEDLDNRKSFVMDGTITVTFGDAGIQTFPGVASDASFDPRQGQANTSLDRMIINPTTVPETKGFLRFGFTDVLAADCGLSDPNLILDARFSVLPDFGAPTTLEVRRVLKPWGDPERDNCISCPGAVTNNHARFNTVPWTITGARLLGGTGTSPAEYHPNQTFVDAAGSTDGEVAMTNVESRIEFAGSGITDAFRFWMANPSLNYGYIVETVGTSGPIVEFWSSEADGGALGPVLSITLAVPVTPLEPDCNNNGRIDSCDIALGYSLDEDESGVPDECELPPCPADWNANGTADVPDIFGFLSAWFAMEPAANFDGVGGIEVSDIFAFLAAWFAGCPT